MNAILPTVALLPAAWPLHIENGKTFIKRAHIPLIQSNQIDAGAITADKIKVGTIKADNIKGGSLVKNQVVSLKVKNFDGSTNGGVLAKPSIVIKKDFPDGCVIVSATFPWEIARNSRTLKIGILRRAAGGETIVAEWQAIPLAGSGVETITGIDAPGKGTFSYFIKVIQSEGREGMIKKGVARLATILVVN